MINDQRSLESFIGFCDDNSIATESKTDAIINIAGLAFCVGAAVIIDKLHKKKEKEEEIKKVKEKNDKYKQFVKDHNREIEEEYNKEINRIKSEMKKFCSIINKNKDINAKVDFDEFTVGPIPTTNEAVIFVKDMMKKYNYENFFDYNWIDAGSSNATDKNAGFYLVICDNLPLKHEFVLKVAKKYNVSL